MTDSRVGDTKTRWVIRDIGGGWFSISDLGLNGMGHHHQLARAFSLARAEVVRDALEEAWPLEAFTSATDVATRGGELLHLRSCDTRREALEVAGNA